MNNNQFGADRPLKELNIELLKVLDEFGTLELSAMDFATQIATAENLGKIEDIKNAQLKMMFLKQKAFYLNLRYYRTLNLIMQKQRDFIFN